MNKSRTLRQSFRLLMLKMNDVLFVNTSKYNDIDKITAVLFCLGIENINDLDNKQAYNKFLRFFSDKPWLLFKDPLSQMKMMLNLNESNLNYSINNFFTKYNQYTKASYIVPVIQSSLTIDGLAEWTKELTKSKVNLCDVVKNCLNEDSTDVRSIVLRGYISLSLWCICVLGYDNLVTQHCIEKANDVLGEHNAVQTLILRSIK